MHSCVEAITRATRYRSSVVFTRWKLSAGEKRLERGGGRKKRDHFSTTIENSRQRIVSRTPRLLSPSAPLPRLSSIFGTRLGCSPKNFISLASRLCGNLCSLFRFMMLASLASSLFRGNNFARSFQEWNRTWILFIYLIDYIWYLQIFRISWCCVSFRQNEDHGICNIRNMNVKFRRLTKILLSTLLSTVIFDY